MDFGMIDFDTALVFFDCPRLDACGDHCPECDGAGEVPVYIGMWLANLASAASIQFGWNLARDYDSVCAVEWYPGCGRPAPGWSER